MNEKPLIGLVVDTGASLELLGISGDPIIVRDAARSLLRDEPAAMQPNERILTLRKLAGRA